MDYQHYKLHDPGVAVLRFALRRGHISQNPLLLTLKIKNFQGNDDLCKIVSLINK